MKDNPQTIVVQLYMGPLIRQSPIALYSEAGAYRMRKSEQLQCLIDQMRPKIKPQSRARTGIFAPTLADIRPKTVDVRLVVRYVAEHTCLQDCLGCKDLAIPSPVMEDGKNPVVLRCDLRERTSFGKGHGKGFIDDDIFSSAQGSGCERKMAFIGTGDHHEI